MGATAIVGDWGSCKTLYGVKWLADGADCSLESASNIGFRGETVGFTTGPELLALVASRIRTPLRERVVMRVLFDEARQMFSCRGRSTFPPAMELICDESRKLKLEIAYATPDLSRVDLNLRLVTTRVIVCQGWFYKWVEHPDYGRIQRPRLVRYHTFKYSNDKFGDSLGSRWYRWRSLKRYTELYDSYFMVESVALQLEEAARALEAGEHVDWGTGADSRQGVTVEIHSGRRGRHSVEAKEAS